MNWTESGSSESRYDRDKPVMNTSSGLSSRWSMREILEDLTKIQGVVTALVTGPDGLVVAAAGRAETTDEMRGALSMAMLGTMQRALAGLDIGRMRYATVETTTHTLEMARLGDMMLVVIATRTPNSEEIRQEVRRATQRLIASAARRLSAAGPPKQHQNGSTAK